MQITQDRNPRALPIGLRLLIVLGGATFLVVCPLHITIHAPRLAMARTQSPPPDPQGRTLAVPASHSVEVRLIESDPFQRASQKKQSEHSLSRSNHPQLKLQTIVLGSRQRLAVINGVLYQEGNVVSGHGTSWTIQQVSADHVILRQGNRELELKFQRIPMRSADKENAE